MLLQSAWNPNLQYSSQDGGPVTLQSIQAHLKPGWSVHATADNRLYYFNNMKCSPRLKPNSSANIHKMKSSIWLLIIIVQSLLSSVCARNTWCDRRYDCVINGKTCKHLLCSPQPSRKVCTASSFVSESEMLKLHNEARNQITTDEFSKTNGLYKACSMGVLSWDKDLASMSEELGKSCLMNMDTCRATDVFKEVGRSVEKIKTSHPFSHKPYPEMKKMFSKWLTSFYTAEGVKELAGNYKLGAWDRGSQALWAATKKVGCAGLSYRLESDQIMNHALICHYGPGGNIPGHEIYPTAGCNNFPETTTSTSTNKTSTTTPPSTTTATITPSSTSTIDSMTTVKTAARGEVAFEEQPVDATLAVLPQVMQPSVIPIVRAVSTCHEMKPSNMFLLGRTIILLLTLNS